MGFLKNKHFWGGVIVAYVVLSVWPQFGFRSFTKKG